MREFFSRKAGIFFSGNVTSTKTLNKDTAKFGLAIAAVVIPVNRNINLTFKIFNYFSKYNENHVFFSFLRYLYFLTQWCIVCIFMFNVFDISVNV